jgi:hypothetical protein
VSFTTFAILAVVNLSQKYTGNSLSALKEAIAAYRNFSVSSGLITTIYPVFTDLNWGPKHFFGGWNERFLIDIRGHNLDWAIGLPRRFRVLSYQRKRAGMDAGDVSWKSPPLVAKNSKSPGYDANPKELVYP